ncbi:hypothetical protein QQ045_021032 [Rhodiola kirilowii]
MLLKQRKLWRQIRKCLNNRRKITMLLLQAHCSKYSLNKIQISSKPDIRYAPLSELNGCVSPNSYSRGNSLQNLSKKINNNYKYKCNLNLVETKKCYRTSPRTISWA